MAITSTTVRVRGVRTDQDTKKALQALYDIFAHHGLGQATFELVPGREDARLIIKHVAEVDVDRAAVAEALRSAGEFSLVE